MRTASARLLLFALLLAPLTPGCDEAVRPEAPGKEIRTLTPAGRSRFARNLEASLRERPEVRDARVDLHVEEAEGDFVVARVVPEPGFYDEKVHTPGIRRFLAYHTLIPPPRVLVVTVRSLSQPIHARPGKDH